MTRKQLRLGRILHQFCLPALVLTCFGIAHFLNGIAGIISAIVAAATMYVSSELLFRRLLHEAEQKNRLDAQLVHSQKLSAIGEMSSGIAHEINTPLAVIGQEAEWLHHLLKTAPVQDWASLPDFKDSLDEIARQVGRCSEITHKLLDFARKRETVIQAADVNQLLGDLVSLLQRDATTRNITINQRFDPGLPAIMSDPPLLRQVVLNLLNNALQAVDRNGVIDVTTSWDDPDHVLFSIHDSGCGISSEHIEKIFNPFFTTKPPGKGTGLGLSISASIVGKLGGAISVTSEPGCGATFTVRLPVRYENDTIV